MLARFYRRKVALPKNIPLSPKSTPISTTFPDLSVTYLGPTPIPINMLPDDMLPNGGAGTEVWRTAEKAVAANSNLVWINDSEVGKLLNNKEFQIRLSVVSGFPIGSDQFKTLMNGGIDADGVRIPGGLWDIGSENYIMDSQSGKFRIFAPFAPDDGVLAQTEMAAMYKRAQDANVHTSLEGMSAQNIVDTYDEALAVCRT